MADVRYAFILYVVTQPEARVATDHGKIYSSYPLKIGFLSGDICPIDMIGMVLLKACVLIRLTEHPAVFEFTFTAAITKHLYINTRPLTYTLLYQVAIWLFSISELIFWTNAVILIIRTLGTNFGEIWIETLAFSLKKIHLKTSSRKCRTFQCQHMCSHVV